MRRSLYIFCFLSVWQLTNAQSPGFSFRNISINEGLSQSSVVDIAVDKTGFLWFATQDGLNRYDGKEFRIFNRNFDDVTTTSGNRLGKITPGNNNELWLITSGGKLEKFNLYDHTFKQYSKISVDSIVLPEVSCLLVRNDQLWIGTVSEGLFIYDTKKNKVTRYKAGSVPSLAENHVQTIFEDKQQRCWVLTKNGATIIDPSKNFESINAGIIPVSLSAGDEDAENNTWLGSFGSGVYLKSKSDNSFYLFTGFDKISTLPADLTVESIKADNEGRVWVGTYGKGLYIINKKEKTIQHIIADKKKSSSLGYNDVLCIKQDGGGGVWIGTDGGGVSFYHKALNNFLSYSSFNLPPDISIEQVRSVTTSKSGEIWAGTSTEGLVYINPATNAAEQLHFPLVEKNQTTTERVVSLLCDNDGDIWIGTQGNGLLIMDAKTKKIKKWFHPGATGLSMIPDHTIWCMEPADNGKAWIGTQNAGLLLIDKQVGLLNIFQGDKDDVTDNNVRAITKSNDSVLYIGYERKGIRLFNPSTGKMKKLAGAGIGSEQITLKCIFIHPPFLLIGTQGKGLIAYNLSSGKVARITETQGLPNNTVYGILEDKLGYLWLSSNKGLSRFIIPADPNELNRSYFATFGMEDGLQSNEFNTGAYHSAANGTLFFGGIKGLTFFNPSHFTRVSQKIPVVITQATINNEAFSGDTIISYKKSLRLSYNQNAVSFNFAALDYLAGSRLNYSYWLKGYDKHWINAGNRNYAAYTNLSPGKYTFEVAALNPVSNVQNPVTSISIHIIPPFWQRWWFIGLCLVAITAALYGFYLYRVNQLLQIQRVRSRIATDLHDDIGSTLTNINILSELSKKNIDNRPEAEKFLGRITEEVSASGQALDDIVWSINKNNDTVEQTVARMRRYAAEIFEGTNINYSLQSDELTANRKLNMELRRDFFLLFKEAINNVYKHAKAKNVRIRVWLERNKLLFMIQDDGEGFDVKVPTHRNGIKNMHTRAGKWKGVVGIHSEIKKGTMIQISMEIS